MLDWKPPLVQRPDTARELVAVTPEDVELRASLAVDGSMLWISIAEEERAPTLEEIASGIAALEVGGLWAIAMNGEWLEQWKDVVEAAEANNGDPGITLARVAGAVPLKNPSGARGRFTQ